MINPYNKVLISLAALYLMLHFGATAANRHTGFIQSDSLPESPCRLISVEARCALKNGFSSRSKPQSWRLVWNYEDDDNLQWVELATDFSHYMDGIDTPSVELKLGRTVNGLETVVQSRHLTSGIDPCGGYNSIMLEWSVDGGTVIMAGDRGMQPVFEPHDQTAPHGICGIMSRETGINIQDFLMKSSPSLSEALITGLDAEQVIEKLKSGGKESASVTGLWEFMDRENNPAKARPGGRYTLAVIESETHGEYSIIYMGGAQVNATKWKPGMLKGRLRATAFEDHYEMTWYDAMMEPIRHDIHADVTNTQLLTLSFPLMQTTLRFSRKQ